MAVFNDMTALVLAMLLASSALAEEEHRHEADGIGLSEAPVHVDLALHCRFEAECFETETCAGTGFAPSLEGLAGGVDASAAMVAQVVLSGDAGDVDLLGVRDGGALWLSGGDAVERHLLTIGADGAARYTVHYSDGPMMISYAGRCETGQ